MSEIWAYLLLEDIIVSVLTINKCIAFILYALHESALDLQDIQICCYMLCFASMDIANEKSILSILFIMYLYYVKHLYVICV